MNGYAETGGDLRERVVPAQVDQTDESTLVRRELAAAVTLTGNGEHGYPLGQGMREAGCGRIDTSGAQEFKRQRAVNPPVEHAGDQWLAKADKSVSVRSRSSGVSAPVMLTDTSSPPTA